MRTLDVAWQLQQRSSDAATVIRQSSEGRGTLAVQSHAQSDRHAASPPARVVHSVLIYGSLRHGRYWTQY